MPRYATLCHVMSCYVTSCHVMSRHVTSCHVMSRHVTSCHAMSCNVMSRHVTSRHVESHHVMTRHVTSLSNRFTQHFIFSSSRDLLLTFLLSHDVWVTSKIQVNSWFEGYWWFCLINFWNFHTIHVFEVRESIADVSTELPCLGYLANPGRLQVQRSTRTRRNWWMCCIDFREISSILYRFWGQGIFCWHSYWATMFEDLKNSCVTSRFKRFSRFTCHVIRSSDKNALNL